MRRADDGTDDCYGQITPEQHDYAHGARHLVAKTDSIARKRASHKVQDCMGIARERVSHWIRMALQRWQRPQKKLDR